MQPFIFDPVWDWGWLALAFSLLAASSVRRWPDAWRSRLYRLGWLLIVVPYFSYRPIDGVVFQIIWLFAATIGVLGMKFPSSRFPAESQLPLGFRGMLAGLSLGVLLIAFELGFKELLLASLWWTILYGSVVPAIHHEMRSVVSSLLSNASAGAQRKKP